MNAIVMGANGGQMPVLWPGGCTPAIVADDVVHACMTQATHLKILGDWIVTHGVDRYGRISVDSASPGDFLMQGYFYTRWPAMISWVSLVINDGVRAFHATKRRK